MQLIIKQLPSLSVGIAIGAILCYAFNRHRDFEMPSNEVVTQIQQARSINRPLQQSAVSRPAPDPESFSFAFDYWDKRPAAGNKPSLKLHNSFDPLTGEINPDFIKLFAINSESSAILKMAVKTYLDGVKTCESRHAKLENEADGGHSVTIDAFPEERKELITALQTSVLSALGAARGEAFFGLTATNGVGATCTQAGLYKVNYAIEEDKHALGGNMFVLHYFDSNDKPGSSSSLAITPDTLSKIRLRFSHIFVGSDR